ACRDQPTSGEWRNRNDETCAFWPKELLATKLSFKMALAWGMRIHWRHPFREAVERGRPCRRATHLRRKPRRSVNPKKEINHDETVFIDGTRCSGWRQRLHRRARSGTDATGAQQEGPEDRDHKRQDSAGPPAYCGLLPKGSRPYAGRS